MFKDFAFKITVVVKILLIILFRIALTEGVDFSFYPKQRVATFVLFTILCITVGRDNKYFSFLVALLGAIIFNPFYNTEFNGNGFDLIEWVFVGVLMIWLFLDFYYRYRIRVRAKSGIVKALKKDRQTGKYRVVEASVIYEIDSSLVKELKEYLKRSNIGSMSNWYAKLPQENKGSVTRISRYGGIIEE